MQFRLWLEKLENTFTYKICPNNKRGDPHAEYKTFHYKVYKNPTKEELLEALKKEKEIGSFEFPDHTNMEHEVRGMVMHNGDLYIWAGTACNHPDMEGMVGGAARVVFYILQDLSLRVWMDPQSTHVIEENPHYRKMMGQPPLEPGTPKSNWQYTAPSWEDAVNRKAVPGGLRKLPYESVQ